MKTFHFIEKCIKVQIGTLGDLLLNQEQINLIVSGVLIRSNLILYHRLWTLLSSSTWRALRATLLPIVPVKGTVEHKIAEGAKETEGKTTAVGNITHRVLHSEHTCCELRASRSSFLPHTVQDLCIFCRLMKLVGAHEKERTTLG